MYRFLWLLPWFACSPSEVLCVDDYDNDGICGAEDVCPVDPGNDDDEDGICAADDICALGDDRVDADSDGIPDACDVCPDDVLNDTDEDGICGSVDPCPEEPGDVCDRTLVVGLQVDHYPEESSYVVKTSSDVVLASGTFTEAGETLFAEYEVSTTETSVCVELTDGYLDGGVGGFVWDKARGELLQRWSYHDWLGNGSFCAEISPGIPTEPEPVPYDATSWASAGACDVTLKVVVLNYGSEIGWSFLTGSLRELRSVSAGTYSDFTTYEEQFRLYKGRHVFRMTDSFRDGWDGTTFSIGLTGSDVEPFAEGTMVAGGQEDVEVFIDCPDDVEVPIAEPSDTAL